MQYNGTEHGLQNVIYAFNKNTAHNKICCVFLFITKYKMYELFKLTKHMKDKDNQYNWKKQDKFDSFGIKILIFTF